MAAAVAMGVLRAVACNLPSATSACRPSEVSASLDADFIGLTGTRLLHYPDSTARHEKHFEERCWCRDAQFSNVSAGVSIHLNNKTWQAMHVKRVLDTPWAGACGSGTAEEGKTTPLQHHCGPRSHVVEPKKHTHDLPRNVALAWTNTNSKADADEDQPVTWSTASEKEGTAATVFRRILVDEGMAVVNMVN